MESRLWWSDHFHFDFDRREQVYLYRVSQKKQDPTNGLHLYKYCFEEGYHIQIMQMPQLLATICQKCGFIQCDSFVVMTSNVNFCVTPILQLFVIALCAVSQPLNRKKNKMVLGVSLCFKLYLEK